MPSHSVTRRAALRAGVLLSTASIAGCLQGSTDSDDRNESATPDRQNRSSPDDRNEHSGDDAGAERTVPWSVELPRTPEPLATTPSESGLFGHLEDGALFAFDFDGQRRWMIDDPGGTLGAIDDEHVYLDWYGDEGAAWQQ